jgi:hypothetical protein
MKRIDNLQQTEVNYKCCICSVELHDDKFNECYRCFNRYFESYISVEKLWNLI